MEVYTDAVKTQLHPTAKFYEHLDILLDALDDAEAFENDLAAAIHALEAYKWNDDDTKIESHGGLGNTFSYRINAEFLLVVRRDTDRDPQHKPILIHLYLKTIERI